MRRRRESSAGKLSLDVRDHSSRGDRAGRDDGYGAIRPGAGEMLGSGRRQHVEGEIEVGLSRSDLARGLSRLGQDLEVRDHRAPLLTQARLIEAQDLLPLESGGHRQDLVRGDDARSADSDHVDRSLSLPVLRAGKLDLFELRKDPGLPSGDDLQKRRAVTLEAGVVLVARGLVHPGLSSEFGLYGMKAHAVRLRPAVAAALADCLVDENALLAGVGASPRFRFRRSSAAHSCS